MRKSCAALFIITALFAAGAASAEDKPNALDFVYEPDGQAFMPPPIRIVDGDFSVDITYKGTAPNGVPTYRVDESALAHSATSSVSSINQTGGITAVSVGKVTMYGDGSTAVTSDDSDMHVIGEALDICTGTVMNITAYRTQIYLNCLRKDLQPMGYTVLNLSDNAEVAKYYGIAGN